MDWRSLVSVEDREDSLTSFLIHGGDTMLI